MISNKVKLKMGNGTIKIDPVFKGVDYEVIGWDNAFSTYAAEATWGDLQNAESYGLFTVDPDGRAYFAPSKVGEFKVKCVVRYIDSKSGNPETIDQELTINIEAANDGNCTC